MCVCSREGEREGVEGGGGGKSQRNRKPVSSLKSPSYGALVSS